MENKKFIKLSFKQFGSDERNFSKYMNYVFHNFDIRNSKIAEKYADNQLIFEDGFYIDLNNNLYIAYKNDKDNYNFIDKNGNKLYLEKVE